MNLNLRLLLEFCLLITMRLINYDSILNSFKVNVKLLSLLMDGLFLHHELDDVHLLKVLAHQQSDSNQHCTVHVDCNIIFHEVLVIIA